MNNTLHLYNRDRVQVAAHRGVAGVNIPCNTIPAFDIALQPFWRWTYSKVLTAKSSSSTPERNRFNLTVTLI